MKKLVTGLLLTSLLAACATEKPKPPPPPAPAAAASAVPAASAPAEVPPPPPPAPPPEPMAPLPTDHSTYYPFNVFTLQSADRPLVEAHAAYLKQHPEQRVQLEGNCDERGSVMYNVGLGYLRADGVREALEADGVKAGQISTVSNGKSKPRMTCHAERCWKENRRTDIIYLQ